MTGPTLAVNLADALQDPVLTPLLIAPHLDPNPDNLIRAEPGVDGAAVRLLCDAETAENVLATVRLRYHPNLFRFYRQGPRGGWTRA